MERTNIILIIIVIILVGVLGMVGGYLLQPAKTNNSTITNQTNITVNNTTSQPSKPDYISASEALEITKRAAAYYPGNETRFTASFVDGDPPYWQVTAWGNDPSRPSYGMNIGGATINAITGEVISAHG